MYVTIFVKRTISCSNLWLIPQVWSSLHSKDTCLCIIIILFKMQHNQNASDLHPVIHITALSLHSATLLKYCNTPFDCGSTYFQSTSISRCEHCCVSCRFVRALHYRYQYTKLGSPEAERGHWWKRSLIGQYLPIVSSRQLRPVVESQGWKWYTKKKVKSATEFVVWLIVLLCLCSSLNSLLWPLPKHALKLSLLLGDAGPWKSGMLGSSSWMACQLSLLSKIASIYFSKSAFLKKLWNPFQHSNFLFLVSSLQSSCLTIIHNWSLPPHCYTQ